LNLNVIIIIIPRNLKNHNHVYNFFVSEKSGINNYANNNFRFGFSDHDFQSRGCTMERKSLLFHVKASFDTPIIAISRIADLKGLFI